MTEVSHLHPTSFSLFYPFPAQPPLSLLLVPFPPVPSFISLQLSLFPTLSLSRASGSSSLCLSIWAIADDHRELIFSHQPSKHPMLVTSIALAALSAAATVHATPMNEKRCAATISSLKDVAA